MKFFKKLFSIIFVLPFVEKTHFRDQPYHISEKELLRLKKRLTELLIDKYFSLSLFKG